MNIFQELRRKELKIILKNLSEEAKTNKTIIKNLFVEQKNNKTFISIEKGFGAKLIECLKEKFLKIVLQSEISLHNYYTSLGFKQHTKHNISYYWSKNNLSQNEVFEEN